MEDLITDVECTKCGNQMYALKEYPDEFELYDGDLLKCTKCEMTATLIGDEEGYSVLYNE